MSLVGHGVEICTSTTRPTTGITAGSIIYETDTLTHRWYNGSTWLGMIPEGTLQPYAGATAPSGWLLCFGQTLNSITSPEYAPLFSVIGTVYGGTGASSFILPDLRGRSPFGKDDMGGSAASRITNTGTDNSGILGTTLGSVGGDQRMHQHTHTQNNHNHGVNISGTLINWNSAAGSSTRVNLSGSYGSYNNAYTMDVVGATATNNNMGTGGSQNMPPAIILNYIIKY